jgi:ferredoxin
MRATWPPGRAPAGGAGAAASRGRQEASARRPTSAARWTWRSSTCWRRRRGSAEAIALPSLPPAQPFGSLLVDTDACTLCLSCVGACPEGALADNPERRSCASSRRTACSAACAPPPAPRRRSRLQPRLWLADGGKARKAPRVLARDAEPYACVRCGKPFGTLRPSRP